MAIHGIKAGTERIKLEEHIPLNTPIRVMIDVSSVCNFHCTYCPHGNSGILKEMPQAIMPVSLARKCIDDLAQFEGKIKMLSFFCIGEPLLQKQIAEIIKYASDRDVAEQIHITTNGSLLTDSLSEALVKAGLSRIDISIYGLNSDEYRKFTGVSMDYDDLVRKIRYLYSVREGTTVLIKINEACLKTPQDKDFFYRTFEPICDKICVEHPVLLWHDVKSGIEAEDGINLFGGQVQKIEVCPVPFYTLCVNADGEVSPCCGDWKHQLPMGNVNTDSLLSIWNGEKYHDFRVNLLRKGIHDIVPCGSCGHPSLAALDNIDPFREELLKRLEGVE